MNLLRFPSSLVELRAKAESRRQNQTRRTKRLLPFLILPSALCLLPWLVRHRVEDDVDPHRVGLLLGELLEVPFVFALALPAIAEVRVVADNDHHPVLVVVDRLEVHLARVVGFPRDAAVAAA